MNAEILDQFINEYPAMREDLLKKLKEYLNSKGYSKLANAVDSILNNDIDGVLENTRDLLSSEDEEERNLAILLWTLPAIFLIITLADIGGIKEEQKTVIMVLEILKRTSSKFKKASKQAAYVLVTAFLEAFTKRVKDKEKDLEEAAVLLLLAKHIAEFTNDEKLIEEINKVFDEINNENTNEN